jgi:lipoyl(octanoyl) transferase
MSAPDARPGAATWRLILGTGRADAAPGAINMAVDQALLESVQRGSGPVLRFYSWAPACLSFGRNQPARELYDAGRAAEAGIDIVRRPTGGMAVLHDREVTYSVLAPARSVGGPRAAYASINRALVDGLLALGIPAEQAVRGGARGPLHQASAPCFEVPAAGEVTAGGRKLVGSAQRCERGALLQHGSILLSGAQTRVLDLLRHPELTAPKPDGSTTLEELTGQEPPAVDIITALCGGFERTFGTRLAPDRLDQCENDRAAELVGLYRSAEWTWRR